MDNKHPAISIVIPCYNGEKYIEKAIASVIEQSFDDYEIIIVNDGSTDNSHELIMSAIRQHPKACFRYINKENNEGPSEARNIAINIAKGEYICFLDVDDYLDKDFCSVMYNTAKHDALDIVVCGNRVIRADGSIIKINKYVEGKKRQIQRFSPCSRIFRLKHINDVGARFPTGKLYEDNPFSIRTLFTTERISVIKYVGYNRVIRDDSITTKMIYNQSLPYESLECNIKYVREIVAGTDMEHYFDINVMAFLFYFLFLVLIRRKADNEAILQFAGFSQYIVNECLNTKYKHELDDIKNYGIKYALGIRVFNFLCRKGMIIRIARIAVKQKRK